MKLVLLQHRIVSENSAGSCRGPSPAVSCPPRRRHFLLTVPTRRCKTVVRLITQLALDRLRWNSLSCLLQFFLRSILKMSSNNPKLCGAPRDAASGSGKPLGTELGRITGHEHPTPGCAAPRYSSGVQSISRSGRSFPPECRLYRPASVNDPLSVLERHPSLKGTVCSRRPTGQTMVRTPSRCDAPPYYASASL